MTEAATSTSNPIILVRIQTKLYSYQELHNLIGYCWKVKAVVNSRARIHSSQQSITWQFYLGSCETYMVAGMANSTANFKEQPKGNQHLF